MHKIQILVVEDDPTWQQLVKDLCNGVGNQIDLPVELIIAENFAEALTKTETITYDCIVLDNELPDGRRANILLDRIAERAHEVPVVVVSGTANPQDVRDFFQEYHIADFFWKGSFDTKKFRQVLEELFPPTDDFTWLHLSDLHFQDNVQRIFQIGRAINALIDDLQHLKHAHGLKPDIIFFTGDLANKARNDEYTKAWDSVLSLVLRECELQPEDLFVIPGNHDIDWGQRTEDEARIIQDLYDASQIQAFLHDPRKSGYYQQLTQCMGNYYKGTNNTRLPFSGEKLSWGKVLTIRSGKKIGIIGLNSAWLSASVKNWDGEVDDQGKLVVGLPLIQEALEEIAKEADPTPDMYIALMHHPLSWLQEWDQQDVQQILSETCTFLLHGHVHNTTVSFLGRPNPGTMTISAGTMFKELNREDVYTCLHAYNITKLDLNHYTGTTYFRKFDPVRWRYGMDDTAFDNVRNGQYSFSYEDNFRPLS